VNEQSLSESVAPAALPSVRTVGKPLANEREERYARLRARLISSRQAAIDAGYKDAHNAARLEKRGRIAKRIAELRQHDEVDLGWQRRKLREELMRVAMARLPDLFEPTFNAAGNEIGRQLKPMSQWSEDERAAVAELIEDKDGIEKVKLHPKLTAIDLLMKLDALVDPAVIALQVNNSTEVNVGSSARARIATRLDAIARRATGEPAGAGAR
jgi:hypothetical protein